MVIRVWDAVDEFRAWLTDHGINPDHCFHAQIDIPRDDILTVTVTCYAVDASGARIVERGDCVIAEPYSVPLQRFPRVVG